MDSQNNVAAPRRKLKFAPKAPSLRKPKPEVKTEVVQKTFRLLSYYPTTLPVRRPYAGNPETLEKEEFGEVAESRTYDENSSNPAMELGLLEESPEKSVLPDVVTYNTLINAYYRFVSFDAGYIVLYGMNEACVNLDVISYNSLISSTALKCLLSKSLNLFDEILQKRNLQRHEFIPQILTYNALINGLCKSIRMGAAKKIPFCLQDFWFLV
ncbi:hypothetical protein Lal_00042646 [Lupinus albus]|nr:hypothetical protein Lal_00042646 [Lupinus albus]